MGRRCQWPTRPAKTIQNGGAKIVGPYTNAETAEKGNGQSLLQTCQKHHMAPMNTWKFPPLTKAENKTEHVNPEQYVGKQENS